MVNVVVVEDEVPFRETLCDFLTMRGFPAVGVGSEKALDGVLAAGGDGIVLLDVNLGRESGFAIARRLRGRHPGIGIIMLTARDATDDHVAGLGAGADVYLTKPVDLRTVEANVVSLSRRLIAASEASPAASGHWGLDETAWALEAPNGLRVALSASERDFLRVLMARVGRTVPFGELLGAIGAPDDDHALGRLAVLVSRLRRKVKQETGHLLPVRSARSTGYGFAAPGDASK